jgi:antitoxin component of MazEF toxin-antitoxin module
MEMDVQAGRIVLWKRNYDLMEMVSRITPENVHPAEDMGPPRGHEQW